MSSACGCAACRAATGAFAASVPTVLRASHNVTKGQPAVCKAESSEDCDAYGTRQFCPDCGTQRDWLGNEGNELDIFAGTLHALAAQPGVDTAAQHRLRGTLVPRSTNGAFSGCGS